MSFGCNEEVEGSVGGIEWSCPEHFVMEDYFSRKFSLDNLLQNKLDSLVACFYEQILKKKVNFQNITFKVHFRKIDLRSCFCSS